MQTLNVVFIVVVIVLLALISILLGLFLRSKKIISVLTKKLTKCCFNSADKIFCMGYTKNVSELIENEENDETPASPVDAVSPIDEE